MWSTTWLKVTNGKQRNEERTRPMVLTLEKPDPSAEAAMITGRPDSVSEPMLLAMFGKKDRKAVASAAKGEVTDPKDQAILLAVRNGARKPKEIVEMTNMSKGTEHRHRKDLMERGLLIEEEDGLRLSFPGELALNSSGGGREGVK